MRNLFTVDKKDYKIDGTVFERPSVRGIIIKDGKILMIHSLKYDYYKLPGGGIENGETFEERDLSGHKIWTEKEENDIKASIGENNLIREVSEESGYVLKPDSIREFGYVRRKSKGMIEDIFIQDNYYFVCETDETQASQNLDDYEADELFTPEFVTIEHAIKTNKTADHKEKALTSTFETMIERENKVFELIKSELLFICLIKNKYSANITAKKAK